MMRFCCLPHWTVAATLALAGLLSTGCDGGPTWNETDPAVGPEDPDVISGVLGSENQVVEGPDGVLVGAPSNSVSEEIGVMLETVRPSEVDPPPLPEPARPTTEKYYRLTAGEEVLQSADRPLAIGIDSDSLRGGGLTLAILRNREVGFEDGSERENRNVWQYSSLAQAGKDRLTTSLHNIPDSGLLFKFLENEAVREGISIEGNSSTKKFRKNVAEDITWVCYKFTFEDRSSPCSEFREIWESSVGSYVQTSFDELKNIGWDGPRLDRIAVPEGGLLGDWSSRRYKIDVQGARTLPFDVSPPATGGYRNPPAEYIAPTSDLTLYFEKDEGGVLRSEGYVRETLSMELTHSFQGAEVVDLSLDVTGTLAIQNNLWIIEGVGKLAEKSLSTQGLERQGGSPPVRMIPRSVRTPLTAQGEGIQGEGVEYKSQDYWYRLLSKNNLTFSFLKRVHRRAGEKLSNVNELPKNGKQIFKESLNSELEESTGMSLSESYWDWAKWQFYEGNIPSDNSARPCETRLGSFNVTKPLSEIIEEVEYLDVEALGSKKIKLSPEWKNNVRKDVMIISESDSESIRTKSYVSGRRRCESNGNEGRNVEIENVPGDALVYVLVSNTSDGLGGSAASSQTARHSTVPSSKTSAEVSLLSGVEVPAPTNFEAQSRNAAAGLSWESPKNPPSSFTGEYNVYRSTSEFEDPSEATLAGEEIAEGSFTDTGLENGQTYYYRVTALYAAEEGTNLPFESDPSPQAEVKPLPDPPGRP